MSIRSISVSLSYLLIAAALVWLGVSIPIHFRAISPAVLEEAGEETLQLQELASDLLNSGYVGPVEQIWEALGYVPGGEGARHRFQSLLNSHPIYEVTGGPAPYLEPVVRRMQLPQRPPDVAFIPFLVPAERRAELESFLAQSTNLDVASLLETRQLPGYALFLPVDTPAGHPLDATALTSALLVQSDALSSEILRSLRGTTQAALAGDAGALAELESFYLAVFSLANRLDWGQLAQLTERMPSLVTLKKTAALLHQPFVKLDALYAALLLSPDATGVVDFLERRGEEGWEVLELALGYGSGALSEMVSFNQPLYVPPPFLRDPPFFLKQGQLALRGLTQDHPQLARIAKVLAFLLAGYAVARFLGKAIEIIFHVKRPPGLQPLIITGNMMIALALSGLLWVLIEPRLLQFDPNVGAELKINLASLAPVFTQATLDPSSAMIDQVTIIVLLMFFVLQLMVFIFGLVKIGEIRKSTQTPRMKIALLGNEENLFDLGLYVGLGGTVASLILVVLNVVEASLMAAYASTLFGIIFTGLLKVCFVRPFRRRLLLESAPLVESQPYPSEQA